MRVLLALVSTAMLIVPAVTHAFYDGSIPPLYYDRCTDSSATAPGAVSQTIAAGLHH